MNAPSKQPVTIRMTPEIHKRLKDLAKDGTTVSWLISQAVEEFLDGKVAEAAKERPALTIEEIEAVIPVLKALGKPVHVGLFFELIETQQGR